jgi:hypothetical protein
VVREETAEGGGEKLADRMRFEMVPDQVREVGAPTFTIRGSTDIISKWPAGCCLAKI